MNCWDDITVYHRDPGPTGRARIEDLCDVIDDCLYNDAGFRFLEIGVFQGDVAEHLLAAYPTMEYTGIDPWLEQPSSVYKDDANNKSVLDSAKALSYSRTERFGGRRNFVESLSVSVAPTIDDGFFDFIYIDGNHSTEAVLEDITLWYPKAIRAIFGHDFAPGWETVTCGVLLAAQKIGFNPKICWPHSSVWYYIK